jgi:hypothetical protein
MHGIGDPDALRERKPTHQEELHLPEAGNCRLTAQTHQHEHVHGRHRYGLPVRTGHQEIPRCGMREVNREVRVYVYTRIPNQSHQGGQSSQRRSRCWGSNRFHVGRVEPLGPSFRRDDTPINYARKY